MDVGTSVRVIGLVAYVQIDPLDIASFVAPGGRWKVLRAPRGFLLLAFAVKVSTCFAREATSFPCSSDFFLSGGEHFFHLVQYNGVHSDRGYVSSWSSISVGIDGNPVVRLLFFVSVDRHT
ncbi:hypothetical protein Bca101_049953 [Brassica carinata]